MAFRYFAYNTGSTIPNTSQVGNIAVFDGGSSVAKTVKWWSGPLEQNGYIIATVNPDGNQPNPDNQPAYISFLSTSGFQEQDFITLAQTLIGGTYSSGNQAKTALINNGMWSSYPELLGLLSVGFTQSFFLKPSGRLWGWGYGGQGTLGNNSAVSVCSPVSICGTIKTFCKISVGRFNGFAIDKDGTVWGWGAGSFGGLGNNSTIVRSTPVSVCGQKKTFCEIAGSQYAGGAIDKYGQVWGWGYNTFGGLGNNSTVSRSTPVSVCGVKKTFCKISGANSAFRVIDKYGQIWGWGNNGNGQLGINVAFDSKSTPVSVCGSKKTFCHIAAGNAHTLSIDKYGQVWAWGNGNGGRLGNNSTSQMLTPVSLCGAKKTFCKITAGQTNGFAIDKYGQVWGWGYGSNGQLGDNTLLGKCTPVSLGGTKKTFCEIGVGSNFTLGLEYTGQLWAWGSNSNGQLGINQQINKCTPISICGVKKTFCSVGTGSSFMTSLDKNGIIWSWGVGSWGVFGNNASTDIFTPVSVCGTRKTFCRIGPGKFHYMAIDKNGQIWTWAGQQTYGELGINSTFQFLTPRSICGSKKTFCHVSGGNALSTSIDKYGQIWTWGDGRVGQLGNNGITARSTPITISGNKKTFCQISSGENSVGSIDVYGQIWGWGSNSSGKLGNGNSISVSTPISVAGTIKTFCIISTGVNHSLTIDKYGQIWGWGSGNGGSIGDNSTVARCTPVSVCGVKKTFCKIGTGTSHSLAIDKNGKAWAWGTNSNGQLGDNSVVSKLTPVSVYGNKTFCDIKGMGVNSVGVDNYGIVWTWGQVGTSGILGNNEVVFKLTPVRVCNF